VTVTLQTQPPRPAILFDETSGPSALDGSPLMNILDRYAISPTDAGFISNLDSSW